MEDKDTELLCKVSANHLFLAQFEPFRATLRSLRVRNPELSRAILQTIVANGGRFDSIIWSQSCPSPALLTFLCTLELLQFNEPTSQLWSFDADALKLRAEFCLIIQNVISRVSDNISSSELDAEVVDDVDLNGDVSGINEDLKGLGESLRVLVKICDMGLRRLRPDLIEMDDVIANEGDSGGDIVVEEEEMMYLRRVFLENADMFDVLSLNIQKQVGWIENEDSDMAITVRTVVKHKEVEDKVLQLLQQCIQIAHLDAMRECLMNNDVDGAVSHIRFLHLNYGINEEEYRVVSKDLLRRVLLGKDDYGDAWCEMRDKFLSVYEEALSSRCTPLVKMIQVFEPVLQNKLKISAEEIETALIEPNDNLAQLHIMLLKGIPPVNKLLKDSNGWVIALSKKLEMWWPWVAEGNFPLTAKKGEEMSTYRALSPTTRLLILKALCEIRADQGDTISYINDETKNRTDSNAFRKEKLGGNGNEVSFWYDGDETIGHRLYKEDYLVDSVSKVKDKKRISAITSQWETLATTFEEFQNFVDKFSSSQVKWEADVGKAVEAHAIPALKKIQRKKDMALKRQQREQRLVEGLRNLAIPRSCRIRKPVNYRCDDFDRAIKEAIEVTNKRKATEEPKSETRLNEHGLDDETNSLDSSPASNSTNSGATDSESESDRPQERNDDVDDTSDEVDEADLDVDGSDLMKGNGQLYHRPSSCRHSKRLARVTSYAVPESTHIGAKHRLRQRPSINTAAESIIIPDSEDEK